MMNYTEIEKQQIKFLRESGLTHKEIFEQYFPDRSKDSILSVCKRNRFIMQPHVKFSDKEKEIIEQLSNEGKSYIEAVKLFPERTLDDIQSFAARNKLKNGFHQSGRKYFCDKEFWDIPNAFNSYWAGFVAADGNVSCRGNSYAFFMSLQKRDGEHIDLFSEHVSYDGSPFDDSVYLKKYDKHYPNRCIRIHQQEWKTGLEKNFCIFPRKTWTLPLPNIEGELLDCYLAGFVDGDGSYVICKNMDKIILSATGASTEILKALNRMSNRFDENKSRIRKVKAVGNHFQFAVAGDTAVRMAHYLMSLPCPHLRRKYEKVRSYLLDHPKYQLSLPPYEQHLVSLAEKPLL